jgi:hypothetical protein
MDGQQVRKEVERIIRSSEVKAVARALASADPPRIGQTLDYVIEPPAYACDHAAGPTKLSAQPNRPYRLVVEQWHLDAAQQMLDEI